MRPLARLLGAAGIAAALACPARADTFADALVLAYQTSPLLEASRASLRALDEEVPIARSRRRPQINAETQATRSALARDFNAALRNYRVQLVASLLLYDHGETRAAIDSARMSVAAGRADLTAVEQDVLFSAAQAYLDLLRDQQVVEIARNNVSVLEEQVRAAQNRFEVGEVTRTDVSLADAALAASRSSLASAIGQLELGQQNYISVVGKPPGEIAEAPPIPELPGSMEQAMAIAYQQNPLITAEQFTERAATYDVDRARAANGPQLSALTELGYDTPGTPDLDDDLGVSIGLSGEMPLYTGGNNAALVRRALAVLERSKAEVQAAGRDVALSVESAWIQLDVARASIVASREEIEAASIAFEGVVEEARLGARSTLDVLDAEQDRLDAEASLVSAQRDQHVAAYALLQAIGLLTVEHLGLGVEVYDPAVHYREALSGPSGRVDTSVVDRIRSRWE